MRTTSSVPAAPTELAVMALGQHELSLTWRDRSDNERAFDIFERPVDGDFSLLRTVGPNTTSLVVEGLPAASYRAYQLRARNDPGGKRLDDWRRRDLLQRGGQSLRSGAGSPDVPGLPAELTGLMPAAELPDRLNSAPPRGRRSPRRRQPA